MISSIQGLEYKSVQKGCRTLSSLPFPGILYEWVVAQAASNNCGRLTIFKSHQKLTGFMYTVCMCLKTKPKQTTVQAGWQEPWGSVC